MANRTLKNVLEQDFSSFEVIVIEKKKDPSLQHLAKNYSVSVTFMPASKEASVADLLNQAVDRAKGKYIHILQPGDFYLSKQGLKQIGEFLRSSPEYDLLYCAYLLRSEKVAPVLVFQPVASKLLQKGKMPTRLQSCWFSRSIFEKIGKFDPRYQKRPGLDLLCRTFLSKEIKIFAWKRVFIDYEPFKLSSQEVLAYVWETFCLVFRYFGLFHALIWWFSQEHLSFLRWGMQKVRNIFQKT